MAAPKRQIPIQTKRKIKGTTKLYSDLYKLNVSTMLKNVSWSEIPEMIPVEHVHFFHTMDSSGKPLTTSTTIGGHYHKIEITPAENPNDPPIIKCISGPVKKVMKKIRGKFTKVEVASEEEDNHTHEVQYISSEHVTIRRMNPEIINMIAQDANKLVAPSGVVG